MKILKSSLIIGMLVVSGLLLSPVASANAYSCSPGRYYGNRGHSQYYNYHDNRRNDYYFVRHFFKNMRYGYYEKPYCHKCRRYHKYRRHY